MDVLLKLDFVDLSFIIDTYTKTLTTVQPPCV